MQTNVKLYNKKSIGGVGAVGCNQSVESITNIVTTNKPDISITTVVTSPPFSNSQQHSRKIPYKDLTPIWLKVKQVCLTLG